MCWESMHKHRQGKQLIIMWKDTFYHVESLTRITIRILTQTCWFIHLKWHIHQKTLTIILAKPIGSNMTHEWISTLLITQLIQKTPLIWAQEAQAEGPERRCTRLRLDIMTVTPGPSRSATATWAHGSFELEHVPSVLPIPPPPIPANCHTGAQNHCCPSAGQNLGYCPMSLLCLVGKPRTVGANPPEQIQVFCLFNFFD